MELELELVRMTPDTLDDREGRSARARLLLRESGTIGAKPTRIPLSIGDGELAETADAVVSVPEMFNY